MVNTLAAHRSGFASAAAILCAMQDSRPPDRAILAGQRVRVRVVSHQAWGLVADILGHHDQVVATGSVDMHTQVTTTEPGPENFYAQFPAVGTELDAVVEEVSEWHAVEGGIRPGRIRLRIRPEELDSWGRRCDFCGTPAMLGPGGDGISLVVLSTDGPQGYTLTAHRQCLADRIHTDCRQRARALTVGKPDQEFWNL